MKKSILSILMLSALFCKGQLGAHEMLSNTSGNYGMPYLQLKITDTVKVLMQISDTLHHKTAILHLKYGYRIYRRYGNYAGTYYYTDENKVEMKNTIVWQSVEIK